MADFGVDNFLGTVTLDGKQAVYKFHDPSDVTNTAEVTLSEKDLDGKQAETREATDLAYSKVAEGMNSKRDTKNFKDQAKQVADKQNEDSKTRQAATDFLDNTADNTTKPVSVDKDGTNVFNTKDQNKDNDK